MIKLHRSLLPGILILLTPNISQAQVLKQGSLAVVENDTRPFIDTLDYTKLTEEEKQVGMALQNFTFQYMKTWFAQDKKEKSLVMSPFSLQQLLSLLGNGADGKARHILSQMLNITPNQISDLNTYNKKITKNITTPQKQITIKNSNALWVQHSFPVYRTFLADSRNYYDADIKAVNFRSADAAITINQWCSEKTNGLINEILPEKPLEYEAILANALYFKGDWYQEFNEVYTIEDDFKNMDGSTTKAQLMRTCDCYQYASTNHYDLLSLPFGIGHVRQDGIFVPINKFAMIICLPHENIQLQDCIDKLSAESWQQDISEMKVQYVYLKLPKYETKFHLDIKEVLNKMGYASLFNGSANYSRLSPHNLMLSNILQDGSLRMDENGCEAAAITRGVMVGAGPEDPPEPIPFFVNRPFIFAIQENKTQNILFLGAVKHL